MTIQRDGGKVVVHGAILVDNVVEMTQQGFTLLDDDHLVVDLSEVTEVDSSAVSMLLEWLRMAQHRDQQLHFKNLPENLASLVQLYGVSDFIPIDTGIRK
ncbi:Phospholipid transport system transporter-binding protein [Nitrosomonas nitrosa]|jgi:phospholipid transport system transporter-binding protein|uniref:Phospholipid transport system transporter-binding protein n=1 Tax=Nitrosomonas nitrosa TaxID=52442 RepID=A0A8H8Z1V4_9PROT|nr:STAS domain-containing protein [Nitrosomonas nitrosa]CAE6517703.1 Phospholipid transport system transporter-binding protein [Nitrosomonas nitrosa]